jgi:uncharacterized LabA/DUF88 family protein/cold shock CspA family protein
MGINTIAPLKVGIFYDGSYFSHISNYYNYVHAHRRRIHIGGLHDLVRELIAEKRDIDPRLCQIVDSHFFRGRFSARDANDKPNQLFYDRVFDDVLMYNNVQTHYLPVRDQMGRKREKGVDMLLALEAYELTLLKKLDVVVLLAADGDFVPLVRKLHALGASTMLLGWDFEYQDEETGMLQTTRTSSDLWNEVTYPIVMHDIIEEGLAENSPIFRELFVEASSHRFDDDDGGGMNDEGHQLQEDFEIDENHEQESTIMSLHKGFGFIHYPDNNLFFLHEDLVDSEFVELEENIPVRFTVSINGKGQRVAKNIRLMTT